MDQNSRWLRNRTVSIIGLAKGTGKTTVLNALLRQMRTDGGIRVPAVTSAGYDGEECGTQMTVSPEILISEGTLAATAAGLLSGFDFTAEVLACANTSSPLGDIYIFKAHSAGRAVLAGPSSSARLTAMKQQLFDLGAECLLIDGAAGRRSVGAAEISDGIFLCTAPWIDLTQQQSAEKTLTAIKTYSLPVYAGEPDAIRLSGAVTDRTAAALLREPDKLKGAVLTVEDPSKLLLSPTALSDLCRASKLTVLRRPELLSVCVNPVSPNGERTDVRDFIAQLAGETDIPIRNILEETC